MSPGEELLDRDRESVKAHRTDCKGSKGEGVGGGRAGPNGPAPTHTPVRAFVIPSELGTTQGSEPRRDTIYWGMIRTFLVEKRL